MIIVKLFATLVVIPVVTSAITTYIAMKLTKWWECRKGGENDRSGLQEMQKSRE